MKVIDYEEVMKCLDEVEDCDDKTYAKSLLEWAINKRTFEAVPLSVIEKIESKLQSEISRLEEIEKTCDYKRPHSLDWVLKLIKDEVKEIKNENV